MTPQELIIKPLITEKAKELEVLYEKIEAKRKSSRRKSNNKKVTKYSFIVHPRANKIQIKQAIKSLYNVTPDKVNIQVYRGKTTRFRYSQSIKPHWKKAIVTFNDGTTLDIIKV